MFVDSSLLFQNLIRKEYLADTRRYRINSKGISDYKERCIKAQLLTLYSTAGCIAIASEQGHDVYDNALETLSSNTTSYEDITFLVLGTYTRYPF